MEIGVICNMNQWLREMDASPSRVDMLTEPRLGPYIIMADQRLPKILKSALYTNIRYMNVLSVS